MPSLAAALLPPLSPSGRTALCLAGRRLTKGRIAAFSASFVGAVVLLWLAAVYNGLLVRRHARYPLVLLAARLNPLA